MLLRNSTMASETVKRGETEKRRATLVSVVAVLALMALKLAVGLVTGSLGVLAQAADSVLDLVASILAFFAVRVAGQPPDAGHPYGHGKVENLAALGEVVLLLVTCAWIVYEALRRIFVRPVAIEANVWSIGTMLLSIAVSLGLATYLMAVARRHRSQSLEGNAINFRTDVLSSTVVLLGLVLVWLGQRLGLGWEWLEKADAIAALLVAMMVLRASLQLGRRAVGELLDSAPPGLAEEFASTAAKVPGVQAVGPVRLRQGGASTFVDMAVQVERSASLQEAHGIATAVETGVGALIQHGDVVVHVDPVRRADEDLPQAVTSVAGHLGLRAHNVHAHQVRGSYFVDVHLEVAPELTLAEAHRRASKFEEAVRHELPHVSDVHTHIEPWSVPPESSPLEPEESERLRQEIAALVESVPGLSGCHNLHVRTALEGYDVVLDCYGAPELSVGEAHRLADQAERKVYAQLPDVAQVLIHVEPGIVG
jgi:cation diffusion facilitator family transporter